MKNSNKPDLWFLHSAYCFLTSNIWVKYTCIWKVKACGGVLVVSFIGIPVFAPLKTTYVNIRAFKNAFTSFMTFLVELKYNGVLKELKMLVHERD